ncbi:MAG TPA: aa3-type cytochrome c oxidase subunit IV [Pararhizobium sp.]|nr:aa3-type cytochrome c oxidase subunit IV [Pararhizobium sp.]
MSTETSQAVQLGAEMDYPEHVKTYHRFLALFKYSMLHIVALLIAMAVGFFGGAGFFTAFIVFVLVSAIGYYLMR